MVGIKRASRVCDIAIALRILDLQGLTTGRSELVLFSLCMLQIALFIWFRILGHFVSVVLLSFSFSSLLALSFPKLAWQLDLEGDFLQYRVRSG